MLLKRDRHERVDPGAIAGVWTMKSSLQILLIAGAGARSATMPALAADYDPPIVVDEAPRNVPVEVGSGWYLRGDVGYSFNQSR